MLGIGIDRGHLAMDRQRIWPMLLSEVAKPDVWLMRLSLGCLLERPGGGTGKGKPLVRDSASGKT